MQKYGLVFLVLTIFVAGGLAACDTLVTEATDAADAGDLTGSVQAYEDAGACYRTAGDGSQCAVQYSTAAVTRETIGDLREAADDYSAAAACVQAITYQALSCGQYAYKAALLYDQIGAHNDSLIHFDKSIDCYARSSSPNDLWQAYLDRCGKAGTKPLAARTFFNYVNTLVQKGLLACERARVKGKLRLFRTTG